MGEPCVQGERLATLETIIEQNSETMADMKDISRKTYEVLSVISEQGAELRELRSNGIRLSKDMEESFIRMRVQEKMAQDHENFIIEHKASTTRFYQFTMPLFAGLTLAAIVAATAFAISMIDQHNYTQRSQPVQSLPIN